MLKINKIKDGSKLTVELVGRLDTTTIEQFTSETGDYDGADELVFDLKELEYISSVGLREVLAAEQLFEEKDGSFEIINVPDAVMEIFDITGMTDILNIK